MRRLAAFAAVACAVAACSDGRVYAPTQPIAPASSSLKFGGGSTPIPGRYIVRYRATALDWRARVQSLTTLHGAVVDRYIGTVFNGAVIRIADAAAPSLLADPNVLAVEQDQMLSVAGTQNNATWGLDRLDQRARPLSTTYSYSATGAGVTAYILDTGIDYSQTDFQGRASFALDYITTGGNAADCNGHGTHVAGTVGSATYGVAKQVALKAVRVLDCTGHGPMSNVIAAVDWITQYGVRPAVVNMSLTGAYSSLFNTAVENSIAAGVTYAVAAGNNAADACTASPSSAPSAIVVGASDIYDGWASFSNFGSCVRILAPGVNITSLWLGNGSVGVLSGTSMAAPHAAGAAALYLQSNPTATPAQVRAALTSNATQGVVTNVPAATPNLLLYTGAQLSQPAPVASFTASCVQLACTFNASATSALTTATYGWTFGDAATGTGITPSHTYATAGTYSVSLTVTDANGSNTKTSNVVVVANQPPIASISLPQPGTFTRDATGTVAVAFAGTGNDPESGALSGAALVWKSSRDGQIGTGTSFSKGTLSVGVHTISLIATDPQGAADTATTTITIAPAPPVASFTSSCTFLSCTFDGTSSSALAGATYAWTFGDATSATGATSVHAYGASGTFTVTLTVTDANGTGTKTGTVTVVANQPPTASITLPAAGTYTRSALGTVSVSFAGSGNDPETGVLPSGSLVWTSSLDGQIGTGSSFASSNLSIGTHTITLTATDAQGATGLATRAITIAGPPPVASFTSRCTFLSCAFDATASFAQSGATYRWDFGDAATALGATSSHAFASGGSYTVTLIVTDAYGTSTTTLSVSVAPNQAPQAAILAPVAGTYMRDWSGVVAIAFSGTGTDPETGALSGTALIWKSSRDGQIGTGASFSKNNLTLGTHVISLIATDPSGAADTATTTITISSYVKPPPVAVITAPLTNSVFAPGLPVVFIGTGSDTEGPLTGASLVWTSSRDGQLGTGGTVTTSTLSLGQHTITLTARSAKGVPGATSISITIVAPVNQPPVASISAPVAGGSAVVGSSVAFDGGATDPESGALSGASLVWTSNRDGQIGTGTSFSTSTLTLGVHTITLIATDAQGATGQATTTITIAAPPNQAPTAVISAPASGSSFVRGAAVTFSGSGSDPETGALGGASLVWRSSIDGQIGTGTSLSTTGLSAGTHTITLTATDPQGASGSATLVVTITLPNQPPTASISSPASSASFVRGASIAFAGSGADPESGALSGGALVWRSNLDGQIGTGTSFSTSSLSVGTHTITLTATDPQGATGTDTRSITINPPPNQAPTASIASPASGASVVQGTSISFAGSASDPESGALAGGALVWTSSRDGQIGVGASFTSASLSVGTHTITLTATDPQGASGTDTRTITVTSATGQGPAAAFSWVCGPSVSATPHTCTLDGSASTGGIKLWIWNLGNGVTTSKKTPVATYTWAAAGTYWVTLTVVDANGQTNVSSRSVVVP